VTFNDYVLDNQRTLLRFAMALTGDARLAEDVVQEVLARAFQRWGRIAVLDRPHAYIRRMIVNEYLSWRRRWARVQPFAEIEPDEVQPDHAAEHAERSSMIARLARLPRKQRAVLALRFYEGLSDAIARTVHVGRTTPLKVPFRLGYLPGGLAATSASNDPHSPVNEGVITFNTDKLIVTVNHQGLDDAVPHCSGAGSKRVTVHGYHGCFRDDEGVGGGRRLELAVPGGWLTVQVRSSHVFSDAVLKRIAASVTLASKLDDPSTWFDAETALSR
jgi:RNA polymerase sigma factor (sigma-70 family)